MRATNGMAAAALITLSMYYLLQVFPPKLRPLALVIGMGMPQLGTPLARMIPIRRRRAVPKEEVLAIFATAPAVDADELRADLDDFVDQVVRDPFEGTGL